MFGQRIMSARTTHSFRQGCHLPVTRQYACLSIFRPRWRYIHHPHPPQPPGTKPQSGLPTSEPPFRRPWLQNLHGTGAGTSLPESDATPVASGFVLTSPPPPTSTLPVQTAAKQISSGHGETRSPGHAHTVSRPCPQGKPPRLLWSCPLVTATSPYQCIITCVRRNGTYEVYPVMNFNSLHPSNITTLTTRGLALSSWPYPSSTAATPRILSLDGAGSPYDP